MCLKYCIYFIVFRIFILLGDQRQNVSSTVQYVAIKFIATLKSPKPLNRTTKVYVTIYYWLIGSMLYYSLRMWTLAASTNVNDKCCLYIGQVANEESWYDSAIDILRRLVKK